MICKFSCRNNTMLYFNRSQFVCKNLALNTGSHEFKVFQLLSFRFFWI